MENQIGVRVELHRNGRRYQITRFFDSDAAAQAWLAEQADRVNFVRFVGYVSR